LELIRYQRTSASFGGREERGRRRKVCLGGIPLSIEEREALLPLLEMLLF